MTRAAQAYHEAAALRVEYEGLSAYAGYLEASVKLELFQLPLGLEALDTIDERQCVTMPFCYKRDWLRAEFLFSQDRYSEARDACQRAIDDLIRSGLPHAQTDLDRAELLAILGLAQLFTGDSAAGEASIDQAFDIASRYDDDRVKGIASNSLGSYQAFAHDYASAETSLLQAVEHLRRSDDRRMLVYTLSNLSRVYEYTGEYALAHRNLLEALTLAEAGFDPSQTGGVYSSLADLHAVLGDYLKAAHYAQRAFRVDLEAGRDWRAHINEARMGTALRSAGKARRALEPHERSLQYFRIHGPRERVTTLLDELALDYLALGQLEAARVASDEAWELRGKESGLVASAAIGTQARVLAARGEPRKALELLQAAHDAYVERDASLAARVDIARQLMAVHRQLGQDEQAIEIGSEAIEGVADIGGQLESYRLGPAWTGQTYDLFLELADLLLAAYRRSGDSADAEHALLTLERGRAVNLARQRLANAGASAKADSADVVQLRRKLAALSADRVATYATDRTKFNTVSGEYYSSLEQLQRALDTNVSRLPPPFDSLKALQAAVPAGVAMVEYACVPASTCHAFVVTGDTFSVRTLAPADSVATLASHVTLRLRERNLPDTSDMKELGRLLIGSVIPEGVDTLVIAASFPLEGTPLAALDIAPEGDPYLPLIDRYALAMTPSMSSYLQARTASGSGQAAPALELAVFADPTFLTARRSMGGSAEFRTWVTGLQRLPWSGKEAEALEKLYADKRIAIYTGRHATRTNLLAEATRRARIVHIASHAFFDERLPDVVGIATAAEDSEGGASTALVTLDQLLALPFTSELVVVSACDTGRGAEVKGEGMMSLSRGFLAQGVDNVISTLWPVSDAASAEFMKYFYEALEVGDLPFAQSLRAAQRRMREDPRHRAPSYWAGYVLASATRPPAS